MELSYLDAIVLGIVEGLTEYLPVSSTAHLTVAEKLLGLPIDDPTVTGYTATIQIGAIVATLIFFRRDFVRLLRAWLAGLRSPQARSNHDYTLAWAVVVGALPICIVAFLARNVIAGPLRSLWVVAIALVLWSGVMWYAERVHDRRVAQGRERAENNVTVRDGLIIGLAQVLSPIPGVSRSGATISAGLIAGINRVAATRLSFFLAIPVLTAAGLYGLKDVNTSIIPIGPMIVGLVVSFVVAYASIAWLLRFVATNSLRPFIYYRVPAGLLLALALGLGWLEPR